MIISVKQSKLLVEASSVNKVDLKRKKARKKSLFVNIRDLKNVAELKIGHKV